MQSLECRQSIKSRFLGCRIAVLSPASDSRGFFVSVGGDMSGFLYTTGPALAVVGTVNPVGGSNGPVLPKFLGTFLSPPRISLINSFAPVFADEGGGSGVPTDRIYTGNEASVSGVLNRFNMPLLQTLLNPTGTLGIFDGGQGPFGASMGPIFRPNVDFSNVNGRDTQATLGVLMGREDRTFDLWILFPNNLSPGMQQAGLVPGYHFLAAFLHGPTDIQPGSGEMRKTVVFQCQRKRTFNQTLGRVELVLFDHLGLNGRDMNFLMAVANETL